MRIAVKLP